MIFASVTICLIQLHLCAPTTQVPAPFDTAEECWDHVNDFMEHFKRPGMGIELTWSCGEDT